MSVFISHSSRDKPAVEALAVALRERRIEVWLDKWEIGPGDDIVASINAGLEEAGCGIIVFSKQFWESLWVRAEASYLQYAGIEEGKVLIPVIVGQGNLWLPPLLRPLARRGIEEVDAIAGRALGGTTHGPGHDRGGCEHGVRLHDHSWRPRSDDATPFFVGALVLAATLGAMELAASLTSGAMTSIGAAMATAPGMMAAAGRSAAGHLDAPATSAAKAARGTTFRTLSAACNVSQASIAGMKRTPVACYPSRRTTNT